MTGEAPSIAAKARGWRRVAGGEEPAEIVRRIESLARVVRTPAGTGEMVWRVWGEGPPVVLLHGGYGSWTHWLRNVSALAERLTVIAPDMPGFGDSELLADPSSVEALADALVRGLDRLVPSPARFDLVGFSFGTSVGGLIAGREGARVRIFMPMGAGSGSLGLPRPETAPLQRYRSGMSAEEIARMHRHNLAIVMFADPARIDDLALYLQTVNTARTRLRSRGMTPRAALRRALPGIRAPIVAVWGERDPFTRPHAEERVRILGEAKGPVRVHVVAGAGHWVAYEAAEEVNAIVLATLAGG
ncbi:MAG: alpha/beta fold hydrolase [Proteobacteria bacterium]|nr:alpha/beta fold hydrolase [Pseudomonadota bacterium]